jgi:hypothetical protein
MSVGSAIRRLLGTRLARRAGQWYRAIYVDLDKMALALAEVIPRDAHLLDIGGGDGQPLNHLLAMRPDLLVTTIDPAPVVGQWIEAQYLRQCTRLPGTTLADYLTSTRANPDAILIADVMHHVPDTARDAFVNSVSVLVNRVPSLKIILKDVEPGYWRASLGLWSDRYITGDSYVSLISRDGITRLFERGLGPLHRHDTHLFNIDKPNYAIVLHR